MPAIGRVSSPWWPAPSPDRRCTCCRPTGASCSPAWWPARSLLPPTSPCRRKACGQMPEPAVLGGPWWPYILVIVGGLAPYFWRALGVALSGRIDADSRLFEWVACVAYPMLAGLLARLVIDRTTVGEGKRGSVGEGCGGAR